MISKSDAVQANGDKLPAGAAAGLKAVQDICMSGVSFVTMADVSTELFGRPDCNIRRDLRQSSPGTSNRYVAPAVIDLEEAFANSLDACTEYAAEPFLSRAIGPFIRFLICALCAAALLLYSWDRLPGSASPWAAQLLAALPFHVLAHAVAALECQRLHRSNHGGTVPPATRRPREGRSKEKIATATNTPRI